MNVSNNMVQFIRLVEGCRLIPYKDVAGKLTIGIGHLIKNGESFGHITAQQAVDLFMKDAQSLIKQLNSVLTEVPTQNEFDAMFSLAYNIGFTNFHNSTLLKLFLSGKKDLASQEFKKWSKATIDGKLQTVEGLWNRRVCEAIIFSTGDYVKATQTFKDLAMEHEK